MGGSSSTIRIEGFWAAWENISANPNLSARRAKQEAGGFRQNHRKEAIGTEFYAQFCPKSRIVRRALMSGTLADVVATRPAVKTWAAIS
jgi:hypothetical protein